MLIFYSWFSIICELAKRFRMIYQVILNESFQTKSLCSAFSIANETQGDLWNLNVLNFFSAWARKSSSTRTGLFNGALKNVNFWQIPILPDLLQSNRYEFLGSIKLAFSYRVLFLFLTNHLQNILVIYIIGNMLQWNEKKIQNKKQSCSKIKNAFS